MKKKLLIAVIAVLAVGALGARIWYLSISDPPTVSPTPVSSSELVTVSPSSTTPTTHTPAQSTLPELTSTPEPTLKPTPELTPEPTPAAPKPDAEFAFKLGIGDSSITVKYGVAEDTLKKNPGWLESSAIPGTDGVCVVYGHRNRRHLRVLEYVELGDSIIVCMPEGLVYTYTVTDIDIIDSTAELRIPAHDGKVLVLVTCYPFQYSGNAPKKYVVTAECSY